MSIEKIHILTGNQDKLRIAQQVFELYGIDVEAIELDVPEIQAATSAEIALHQVAEAYRELQLPVVREDHSFFIDAINFPGPFMAYANKSIPVNHLLKMIDALPSRAAHFEIAGAYADGSSEPFVSSFQVPVEIGYEARGSVSRGWDTVLQFPGSTETFAETTSNHDELWSTNYHRIAEYILSKNVHRS